MKTLPLSHRLLFGALVALWVGVVGGESHARAESSVLEPIAYEHYGRFEFVGTERFGFAASDLAGLAREAGEGVYPNQKPPSGEDFEKFKRRFAADSNVWKWADGDAREAYWAWFLAKKADAGVRQFFVAESLRRMGRDAEAVRAYYAVVVHFSKTVIWSPDGAFYWYAAPEAISRIRRLCAEHPEWKYVLDGVMVDVERGPEKKPEKDRVRVWPGRFVAAELKKEDPSGFRVRRTLGGKKTQVVQFENGHWQLKVNGAPFVVRGVTYDATYIGQTPHDGSLRSWMKEDRNQNGLADGPRDAWVDTNRNDIQDADEPAVGDMALMARMGVNAIRYYHTTLAGGAYDPAQFDKNLLRELHQKYGIGVIMSDFFGAYTQGSGAPWNRGTDYTDAVQQQRMLESIRQMVLDHREEPYVLFWMLGNENQHPNARTNAAKNPRAYARFVNQAAQLIHELDPDRPVSICHLGAEGLKAVAELAPEVDIYGANVYSGEYSMGSVTQLVKAFYDRPLLFTEWGCDSYHSEKGPDEAAQAKYLASNWKDMTLNMAGNTGEGNVIGGVVFEWLDEWWKSRYDSAVSQSAQGENRFPFPDGWVHEEWMGVVGQGSGRHSPFQRVIKAAYEELRGLWSDQKSQVLTAPLKPIAESAAIPHSGPKAAASAAPTLSYSGEVLLVDVKAGTLALKGYRDEDTKEENEILVKLQVDRDEAYVSDSMNHFLEWTDVLVGDYISVDCEARGDTLWITDIQLHGVRNES